MVQKKTFVLCVCVCVWGWGAEEAATDHQFINYYGRRLFSVQPADKENLSNC